MSIPQNPLLLALSRISPVPGIRSLFPETVDWDLLFRQAGEEGVAPLVYGNLKTLPDLVPAEVLERFKSVYIRNSLRNAGLFLRLAPLLEGVRRAGLRAVVMKGARLAVTVYGDIGLRPFTDIDVFVHPDDWPGVEKILAESGFSRVTALQGRLDPHDRDSDWLFSPYYRKENLLVELHFAYLGLHVPFRSRDDFWATLQTASIGKAEAPVLSPEYELCYLCLHAQQHSYGRLVWLSDIAELATRGGIDWDRIERICREEGITAGVRYGLELAEALWPDTVPEAVLSKLEIGAFESRLLRFFWPVRSVVSREGIVQFPYYATTFFCLFARRQPLLAVRTLFGILFPPRSWIADSYNIPAKSPRIFLRYVQRMFGPFRAYLKRGLRLR
jgi:hypothetical protein